MTATEISRFFEQQLAAWPTVESRYAALADVAQRTVDVGGFKVTLQHNPARAISTAAPVDKASIAARPCFLCDSNRPAEQLSLPLLSGRYKLLVNPFPIFRPHFTIPLAAHEPQSLAGRLGDMLRLAAELEGLAVFFNGAKAGASAPDHMHFQAVAIGALPLIGALERGESIPYRVDYFKASSTQAVMKAVDGIDDSLVNVISWYSESEYHVAVIPRRCHRPSCYGEEGYIISPASVDLAGVVIVPRHSDYEKIDAEELGTILNEVTYSGIIL